jgi:hypothetical protein
MSEKSLHRAAFVCLALTTAAPLARAEQRPRADAARPVVVEMFLSQACQASPPAAESLRALSNRSDIVALGWHVDYWNANASKDRGVWSDPFSRPEFTTRQKLYNKRIRGRGTVFTPQAIVDGFISVVGSDVDAISERISEAQFADELSRPVPPRVDIFPAPKGDHEAHRMLSVEISDVGAAYDAFLVNYRPASTTFINGGDNAGTYFQEINVVVHSAKFASDVTGRGKFDVPSPEDGLGCAVLVQERNQGRIVAARYCSQ